MSTWLCARGSRADDHHAQQRDGAGHSPVDVTKSQGSSLRLGPATGDSMAMELVTGWMRPTLGACCSGPQAVHRAR